MVLRAVLSVVNLYREDECKNGDKSNSKQLIVVSVAVFSVSYVELMLAVNLFLHAAVFLVDHKIMCEYKSNETFTVI